MSDLVSLDAVYDARDRIREVVIRTPLVRPSRDGDRATAVKPESLQPTGAFKLRGAYNAVAALDVGRRRAGVVAHSSGNHGRAVAWAARAFGVPAVVVTPDDAPAVKVDGMRALGAELIFVAGEPIEPAEQVAAERGATLIRPYDAEAVIAGQGTVGVEIAEDAPDVEVVLVPVGGGGLISGVALAVAELCPKAKVIGVEPELAADASESLASGRLVEWTGGRARRTIADGLRSSRLGELPWAHVQRYVHEIVTVTEDEIRAAMRTLALDYRLVAEPSGAVAPAAAFHHDAELPPGRTVAIVSGGNVEPGVLAEVLGAR
ncbi:MAG: threonine/serine dehydratase [Streptosporangiales bacterium]|nr:threonine/serine dehydratase [Streptosporangiales bacterium]MBO0892638.1 threonine/serine dehydratase [Acidothermales bacterium]